MASTAGGPSEWGPGDMTGSAVCLWWAGALGSWQVKGLAISPLCIALGMQPPVGLTFSWSSSCWRLALY